MNECHSDSGSSHITDADQPVADRHEGDRETVLVQLLPDVRPWALSEGLDVVAGWGEQV